MSDVICKDCKHSKVEKIDEFYGFLFLKKRKVSTRMCYGILHKVDGDPLVETCQRARYGTCTKNGTVRGRCGLDGQLFYLRRNNEA